MEDYKNKKGINGRFLLLHNKNGGFENEGFYF